MVTRRRALELLLVAVLVVAAWAQGRASGPTRELRTTQTVAVERIVLRERAESASSSRADVVRVNGPVRTVTRWVPGPGCPGPTVEIVREEAADTVHKAASADQRSALVKESATTREHIRTEVQLVERARPRWAAGVDGGLRFSDATAIVRGRFEVRALGPLWIGVWGDPTAAGTGVRLEW